MDRVYLVGSDEVSRAGSTIRSAADDIQRAASTVDGALYQAMQNLDYRLDRFVAAVDMMTRCVAAYGEIMSAQTGNRGFTDIVIQHGLDKQ